MRVTSANDSPVRAQVSAASSHALARRSILANASVATPPQHWPRRAASGKRTIHAPFDASVASASRAMRSTSNSRWPPPMEP